MKVLSVFFLFFLSLTFHSDFFFFFFLNVKTDYEQENEQKKPDDRTNELGISVDKIEAEEEIFSWYLSQYCTTAEQIKQNKIFCNQLLSKFEGYFLFYFILFYLFIFILFFTF